MPRQKQATVYVYRIFNDIFGDFYSFMYGNVQYEPTDADTVRLNQGLSVFQRWWDLITLPEDGGRTEERTSQYRSWLEKRLMFCVIDGDFHIWSKSKNNFAQQIARGIVGRAIQSHKDISLQYMR